ncbi:nuclear transport factor 2 family protein [Kitasatospora acidiphila]|uniref:nuclear transport factor 2 family protein n=1 Tax=Kitasatospora acidiphila TaxID=2567942 RepID=UPI0015F0E601|nr:nuclear transport factor 2 family protein [Kitasatospora acidiphila]
MTEYLAAFLAGDIAKARSAVSDDFSFRAPLMPIRGTKEQFFAGAERKTGLIRDFRILRLWQDGDEVSCVYEIDVSTPAGQASMLLHEWHVVRQGLLVETTMVFDTQAQAAHLIHDALR